ncbi:NAD binding domain of 6-phosphogluconate dehydrogenase-domain-containing protein [Plectosphaerella plurivora]|uniref:3-hydroxyisobutyrate dehydrogenase n=1 Tax=Plectosphaerella plurivora TaxID=936078 RepID=A0A9P9A9G7_9PEZI|nr:NAD binding domain of 6-phosphogluconate dehydrogenase-domain-containing protein [Plectosphaerella plurivora]
MSATTSAPAQAYGFIGLGVMGYGMAMNLRAKLPKTASIYVCELNMARRDQWVAENKHNTHVAETPFEIAKKSDVIITMLPKGQHVRRVFTDPTTGLLAGAAADPLRKRLFIDCSTIDVATSREMGAAVNAAGAGDFADAPVSGGVGGADAGTLTFMVGTAEASLFETRLRPILSLMGKPEALFHCGGPGAGLGTKLINNYMSALNMIGVCEGMDMGRRLGLDPVTLAAVVNTSTGMSRNSREQNPVKGVSATASAASDFEGGFSTELCFGVVDMAVELGMSVGTRSVLAETMRQFYAEAVESELCKGKDFRSIWRLISEEGA